MAAASVKNIVVLGSTGSVGTQTLDVVRGMPGRFRVVGLSSNSQWELLARQVEEFRPDAAAICDERHAESLARAVNGRGVELLSGPGALTRLAAWDGADVVVSAVSGGAGLPAAVAAIEGGKALALANKEALVMGGPMLVRLAERRATAILPVDSEHSAIFQLLRGVPRQQVARVILTASGGPFHGWSSRRMEEVTPRQALAHPTWRMGRKITIDSATLMNKALEIIEARWLFGLPADRISVLVHPQSIIHGIVELVDGSLLAHMGLPDMRMPIQYALNYPERSEGPCERLDLARLGRLEFCEPDMDLFPALKLGYRVAREGGTSGAVLNAANETAVEQFLAGRIRFTRIVEVVETVLAGHRVKAQPGFDDVMAADKWAREEAERCC
jgi:1-deoxy-D-xylulose-5-phosphate reductoisomerase